MTLGVLDNRDSFTFNLVHLLEPHFDSVVVRRCDAPDALDALRQVDALVLSPGPGLPHESGALMDVIADHFGRTPMLGVCLGMQALAEFTGGTLQHTGTPRHGIARVIRWIASDPINERLSLDMTVGWYHSWAVNAASLDAHWTVLATDHEGLPAAIAHDNEITWGVQFHPESIMTPEGSELLASWAASSRQGLGGAGL